MRSGKGHMTHYIQQKEIMPVPPIELVLEKMRQKYVENGEERPQ
jgi:hypothetical protein